MGKPLKMPAGLGYPIGMHFRSMVSIECDTADTLRETYYLTDETTRTGLNDYDSDISSPTWQDEEEESGVEVDSFAVPVSGPPHGRTSIRIYEHKIQHTIDSDYRRQSARG